MALEINGAVKQPEPIFRTVVDKQRADQKVAAFATSRLAAYWRGVPHWDVPPAFADSGKALAALGTEAYKEAVRAYYEAICQNGVERAQRTHSKWAVRCVLRAFETHIRGYRRQDVGRKGSIVLKGGGSELIHPETLWKEGRLIADLNGIMRQYQVRSDLREAAVRLARAKLATLWGLK